MTALIYVDANVIINFLEGKPSLIDRLGRFFRLADEGKIKVVTSDLSLAEVLVGPLRRRDTQLLASYEAILAPKSIVTLYAIDRPVWVRAALLRAANRRLRLPDAVHVAMAQHLDCRAALSSDKRLQGLIDVRLPIVSPDSLADFERLIAEIAA